MARGASSRGAARPGRARTTRGSRGISQSGGSVIYGLLLVTAIAVLAVGGYAYWRQQSAEGLDAQLCPSASGPEGYLLIAVDLTDAVEPAQLAQIRSVILAAVEDSPLGTMTALGVVSDDPSRMGARFALCKPQAERDASEWTENRRMIAKRYQDQFAAPLATTLDAMLAAPTENSSPIMEGVQALVGSTEGFLASNRKRRLIVASDLLQNSDAMSFYRGEDWDTFRNSPDYSRLSQNLKGVSAELLHVQRRDAAVQLAVVREFWAEYFAMQGAGRIHETVVGGL